MNVGFPSSFLNILCFLQYESDEQEKSAYQEYDSDSDVPEELKRDYVDEQTGDAPVKRYSCSQVVWYFAFYVAHSAHRVRKNKSGKFMLIIICHRS